jgi:hypothetical protein
MSLLPPSTSVDPLEPFAQRSYAPLRLLAIVLAVVGLAGLAYGFVSEEAVPRGTFWRAYLVGMLLWLGTSLGCLFFVMTHNLSGGEWGKVLRRPLEAGIACIPFMAVLFIPLFFNLSANFEWADPTAVAADRVLQHKKAFLNPTVVTGLTVFFLVAWSLIATILYGQGRRQREAGETGKGTRLGYRVSAGGMVFHFFSVTFFLIIWVMSRDSHWYSSIIGFVNMASQGLMAMSLCTFVLCWRFARSDDKMPVERMTLNDVGTIILANTIFWTYTAIAQLIIIYSGNTAHEQTWYIARGFGRNMSNGWQYVAVALLLLGFVVPFLALLNRPLKQRMRLLMLVCVLVFAIRIVDVIWWVVPSGVHVTADPAHPFHPNSVHWVDFAAIAGLGGIWLLLFFYFLAGRRVLSPATDPKPHAPGHTAEDSHAPAGGQVVSHA